MTAAKKTTRVQFELSDDAYARLNRIKDRTDATSYTEVCKRALRLNAILLERLADGSRLYMSDGQGNMTEIIVIT